MTPELKQDNTGIIDRIKKRSESVGKRFADIILHNSSATLGRPEYAGWISYRGKIMVLARAGHDVLDHSYFAISDEGKVFPFDREKNQLKADKKSVPMEKLLGFNDQETPTNYFVLNESQAITSMGDIVKHVREQTAHAEPATQSIFLANMHLGIDSGTRIKGEETEEARTKQIASRLVKIFDYLSDQAIKANPDISKLHTLGAIVHQHDNLKKSVFPIVSTGIGGETFVVGSKDGKKLIATGNERHGRQPTITVAWSEDNKAAYLPPEMRHLPSVISDYYPKLTRLAVFFYNRGSKFTASKPPMYTFFDDRKEDEVVVAHRTLIVGMRRAFDLPEGL